MIKTAVLQNARFLVMVLLALLVFASIYFFREVILPFAVSAFFAYLIAPVIDRIARIKVGKRLIHRGIAIVVVYAVALGGLSLSGMYFVPKLTSEANRLVKDLPVILHNIEQNWISPLDDQVNEWLAEFFPLPEPEENGAEDDADGAANGRVNGTAQAPGGAESGNGPAVEAPPMAYDAVARLVEEYTYVVQRLDENRFEVIPKRRDASKAVVPRKNWDFSRQITQGFRQFRTHFENNILELLQLSQYYVQLIVTSLFSVFLVLMTSAFILLDPVRVYRFMCSLVPTHHQKTFEALIARLDRGLAGVVRGQLMICMLNGTMTGIGIAIIGVPFVVTLTMIATVFSLIPIFGVLISTIPIMLVALTVSFGTAGMAMLWIMMVHFFEGNFLNPKIMGDSSHIHPVLIIFALVAGEYLAGILGALVAVPIFSLVQNSFLFLKGLAEEAEATS